jgi:hypothetical protein
MSRQADAEHERWLDEIISLTEAAALRKVSVVISSGHGKYIRSRR